jgi:hypothetical protein
VGLALEKGGRDNVTVIVAEYSAPETAVDDAESVSD